MLRLFNDCWTQVFLMCACWLFTKRQWTVGGAAYALALSVKMNALLYLPGMMIVIMQAAGLERAIRMLIIIAEIQVDYTFANVNKKFLLAVPFTLKYPYSYVTKAFNLGRAFLWKWTVNWRFVGEEIFLSRKFALALLCGHLLMLLFFIATRWLQYFCSSQLYWHRPSRMSLFQFIRTNLSHPQQPLKRDISSQSILTILFTSNMIGCLFARSLHYQFYSWTAWTMPFLLWQTGWNPVVQVMIWLMEEWAWNVYPSSRASSIVVVGVYAAVLVGVWWNTEDKETTQHRRTRRLDW